MYKIEKDRLSLLFQEISAGMQLYVPAAVHGEVNLVMYGEGVEADLETLKTVKSQKDAFFPQSENLYSCVREGKKITIKPEEAVTVPFVVFGMRPCDVKGLEVLDQVFLTEPYDSFYASRRKNGIIVSLACHEPEESCFCTAFGTDPSKPAGDVAAWMLGEYLYLDPVTEKGVKLIEKVSGLLTECAGEDHDKIENEKAAIRSITEKLPYHDLSLEGWGKDALYEKFDSPVWDDLYKACLGCGTCTFVCPTCQCYDIRDYNTGHETTRFRCWDSCMYSDFTMMAHGNNRKSQKERYRQRFMHKLAYHPANHEGTFSCVGCGRCVEKCPASLNIVKVIRAFEKKGAEKNE